jgi:GntR family histidine utilization transcriptional repressor
LTEGEHIVEAVRASAEECALLNIKEHDPCLLIRRRPGPRHPLSLMPVCCSLVRYRLQGGLCPDTEMKSVIADAI